MAVRRVRQLPKNIWRSKYGATPTVVDGIRFHSAKEARRYGELKLLEKAGEVSVIQVQPRFELSVTWGVNPHAGTGAVFVVKIGDYVADFAYWSLPAGCNERYPKAVYVVEDVKGFKTPLYRWKKKHVEAQYGIQIREV